MIVNTVRQRPTRARFFASLAALSILTGTLVVASNVVAAPTNYVDITNHQVRYSGTGTYDWANSGLSGGTNTCTGSEIHVTGTGGLFDCGVFNGTNTPPTAPRFIPTSDTTIPAGGRVFGVDP